MRILNYGSLNLDYTYHVQHIVAPGETVASSGLEVFCGGKGLNQSIALAKAGASVFHGGMTGEDGDPLLEACRRSGVDSRFIRRIEGRSGSAVIQVERGGQNSIVLYGGANQANKPEFVDEALAFFEEGEWLLLQNEVNGLDYMIEKAHSNGLKIALNPSPFQEDILKCGIEKVSLLFLNEVEGEQLTKKTEPEQMIKILNREYPDTAVVLTLGGAGAVYAAGGEVFLCPARKVEALDTTGAGDTFTGYFLAALTDGKTPRRCLEEAAAAAAIAVSRLGASASIPERSEVEKLLNDSPVR